MANPDQKKTMPNGRHQYSQADYRILAMYLPPVSDMALMDDTKLYEAFKKAQKHLPADRQRLPMSILRTCAEKPQTLIDGVERARAPVAIRAPRPVAVEPAPAAPAMDLANLLPQLKTVIFEAVRDALAENLAPKA